jgi:hypothetical protein
MNIKTVKTVRLISFMIILPMVEIMGYGEMPPQRDWGCGRIYVFILPLVETID